MIESETRFKVTRSCNKPRVLRPRLIHLPACTRMNSVSCFTPIWYPDAKNAVVNSTKVKDMNYQANSEHTEQYDSGTDPRLVLDGTVNLDDPTDDELPRVKGLVELISDFLRD